MLLAAIRAFRIGKSSEVQNGLASWLRGGRENLRGFVTNIGKHQKDIELETRMHVAHDSLALLPGLPRALRPDEGKRLES